VGVVEDGPNTGDVKDLNVSLVVAEGDSDGVIDGCDAASFTFDIDNGLSSYVGDTSCIALDLTNLGDCMVTSSNPSFTSKETIELTPSLMSPTCSRMEAPSIYSMVEYDITADGVKDTVKYYSNKLPRIAGNFLDNLSAIIHGTIYSSLSFSPDKTDTVSSFGSTVSNEVRDSIHRNINEYIKGSDAFKNITIVSPENGDADRCVMTLSAPSFTSPVCSGNGNSHRS